MTDIDQIDDVAIFRPLVRLVRQQEQTIKELRAQVAEMTAELARLKERVGSQQRKLFGKSSERRTRQPREKRPKKKRTKFGYRAQPDLPVETTKHTLDPDANNCLVCGGQLEPKSHVVEAGEEITVQEREYKIVRHVRSTYGCRCPAALVTAPGPVKLIHRGRYSLDFAISVAVDKYLQQTPLARQVRAMETRGLIIDTQTLWDQVWALANHLKPSYELIQSYIVGADVIGADETWWRVMEGSSSQKWWVWTITTHDAVFYHVDQRRNTDAARRCLGKYKGIIVCDAYKVYQSIAEDDPELSTALCWSHARRKFVEAHDAYPDECEQALGMIDELFLIERKVPAPDGLEGDPKADALARRTELRASESRPITEDLERWAKQQEALPKSSLRKAIGYMLNQWEGLTRFLDDPRIPIHNNHTEQEERNWAMGRKNHYGSRSKRGTLAAAILYTLIETARLCGVDPTTYLRVAATAAILNPGKAMLPHELMIPH